MARHHPSIMRVVYTALLYCALPFVFARLLWRSRKIPDYRRRWNERLGWYSNRSKIPKSTHALWLHAVSVGEVEAALPLVHALQNRYPQYQIVITTTTPTGSSRVRSMFGESVCHVYLPYDLPGPVHRFLTHFQPMLAVIMETELWPNLFIACRRRKIPLILVNGRMSPRSYRGYQKVPGLIRETLACFHHLAVQTRQDARRFRALGAAPEKITVTGNLKFDVEWPGKLSEEAAAFRTKYWPDRIILLGASTHEGEEAALVKAYQKLRKTCPNLLLILVPRHPDRIASVVQLCQEAGFTMALRSQQDCRGDEDIFLLDTLGELKLFYSLAEIAFVGGSLVAAGGHNVLEPARAGVPVLFGPYMTNAPEVAQGLEQAGGGMRVDGLDSLTQEISRLLGSAETRQRMGRRGQQFLLQNQGALERTLDLIAPLLTSARRRP